MNGESALFCVLIQMLCILIGHMVHGFCFMFLFFFLVFSAFPRDFFELLFLTRSCVLSCENVE